MRALVVYESMFGNTRDVARAVADGVGARMPVELVEVADAPTVIPADVSLLLIGGPTHAHGLSSAKTRADAAGRAGDKLVSRGGGLADWLGTISPAAGPIATAAFDTRIKGPGLLWGSAAKAATKLLRARHFSVIAQPVSFLVGGPTGPMFNRIEDGESDRARAWGASLADALLAPAVVR
ncbi:MAG: flavodoxin domain-containing protein [Chloroflexota bacterium]